MYLALVVNGCPVENSCGLRSVWLEPRRNPLGGGPCGSYVDSQTQTQPWTLRSVGTVLPRIGSKHGMLEGPGKAGERSVTYMDRRQKMPERCPNHHPVLIKSGSLMEHSG